VGRTILLIYRQIPYGTLSAKRKKGARLMIDMHCHILPGVDNGAKNMEESIAIANAAVEQGIDTVIATPQHMNGNHHNFKKQVMLQVEQLNNLLKERQIDLTVVPGQMIRIYREMLTSFDKDNLLALNHSTGYLLIDLPRNHIPSYTTHLIFDLQIKGYQPILVHPEKNPWIQSDPELLYQFVKKGALTQLAADSIVGKRNKAAHKFALKLIEANQAHFIASEATNHQNYNLREAIQKIDKLYGKEMAYYFVENAVYLMEGKAVIKNEEKRIKKKKLLGIL